MFKINFSKNSLEKGLVQSLFKRNLSTVNELAAKAESTRNSDIQGDGSKDAESVVPPEYRFIYPEFLPEPAIQRRNKLGERLERMDMIQRRSAIEIPEFCSG